MENFMAVYWAVGAVILILGVIYFFKLWKRY